MERTCQVPSKDTTQRRHLTNWLLPLLHELSTQTSPIKAAVLTVIVWIGELYTPTKYREL